MTMTAEEWAPAKGADALYASPNGNWIGAQYNLAGPPPLIKIFDRATGAVKATARGQLAGRPNDDGEAFYLDGDAAVRSTTRADFRVQLPGDKDEFWRAYRTKSRVIVTHGGGADGGKYFIAAIRTDQPKLDRSREIAVGPDFRLVAATAGDAPLFFVSAQQPRAQAPASKGAVIALDEVTLEDRWRAPWKPETLYEQHPALGLTGDGTEVVANTGTSELHAIAVSGGKTDGFVKLPVLWDYVDLQPVPDARAVIVLSRSKARSAAANEADVLRVDFPSGKVTQLWSLPKKEYSQPRALVVVGDRVLLAPGHGDRFPNDRSTWGAEVTDYVK